MRKANQTRARFGATVLLSAMLSTIVWAQQQPPQHVFGDYGDLGHWEFRNASWNDFDGDYRTMKLHHPEEGTPFWCMSPGWYLRITPDGRLHADNGNDAVLTFRADRDCAVKFVVPVNNEGGAKIRCYVSHNARRLLGKDMGPGSSWTGRGLVELGRGDVADFRVGHWHWHGTEGTQNQTVIPQLTEVGVIPDVANLPLAPGFPQINGEGQFPIGFLHYTPDAPLMDDLREMGFDAFELDIQWHRIEPQEGQYSSDAVTAALDGAAKHGMRAALLLSWHMRPGWLPEEWKFTSADGKLCRAHWLPVCIWNPEVRAHQAQVIETICSVSAKHPATLCYVLANEPDMGGYHIGYGPYALQAFREWLRDKYGSVRQLNVRWGTKLPDLDAVQPPRPFVDGNFSLEALQQTDRAAWLDWITFRNESFADYWQFLADEIRKHHPDALITNKLMWKGVDSNIAAARQQNYRMWAKALNVMGNDPYPHPYENFIVRWLSDASWSYGQGKRTWFTEWNSAFLESPTMGYPKLPVETYSAWMWQALGRGVCGFLHWRLTPTLTAPDGGDYAFADGTFAESFWAVQRTVGQIRKIQPWLMRAAPASAEIAILQSWPTFIQQPNAEPGSCISAVQHSLYNAHLSYRYIDDHMLRHEDWAGVKVLLLPGSICLAQEDWQAVDRFVQAGGWVVAWPKSGDRDEVYEPHPHRVTERFGVQALGYKQRELAALDKTTIMHEGWTYEKKPLDRELETVRWAKLPATVEQGAHLLKEMAGITLGGGERRGFDDYHQSPPTETIAELDLVNARVIARFEDGSPAITQNGHFIYIASSPMHYGPGWDEALRRLVAAMGVRPHGYVLDNEGHHIRHVDLAMMQGEGFRLAVVTNHALSYGYDGRPVHGLTVGLQGDGNTRVVRLLDVPEELFPEVQGEYVALQTAFMPGEAKVFLLVP